MREPARQTDVPRRIFWGLLLAGLAIAAILLGGIAFLVLVAVASAALCYEWSRLCRFEASAPAALLLIGGALAGQVALALPVAAAGFAAGAVVLAAVVIGAGPLAGAGRRAIWLGAGVAYFAPTAFALPWLMWHPAGGALLIGWLFVVTWATDTGAFAAGRLLGGPKLAPAISPAKTWSGLAGGLGAAAAAGALYGALAGGAAGVAALAGAGFGALAVVGDLFESFLKRRFAVKDTSNLIPGHGGVLDRLDSLLWTAPALAVAYAAGLRLF